MRLWLQWAMMQLALLAFAGGAGIVFIFPSGGILYPEKIGLAVTINLKMSGSVVGRLSDSKSVSLMVQYRIPGTKPMLVGSDITDRDTRRRDINGQNNRHNQQSNEFQGKHAPSPPQAAGAPGQSRSPPRPRPRSRHEASPPRECHQHWPNIPMCH